jgi:predicted transcriptional regulator
MSRVTKKNVTPQVLRTARAWLDWTAVDLAEKADVGVASVRRFESGKNIRLDTMDALIGAIEAEGLRLDLIDNGIYIRPANDTDTRDCA